MKEIRLVLLFLFLMLGVTAAQQTNLYFLPGTTNGIAFEEIKTKAEKGDANAQLLIADCYSVGRGVPLDQSEAVKWYRKAAEQGNAVAQCTIGEIYSGGLCGLTIDNKEAVKWYRLAAEQGIAEAQFNLSSCYRNGQGVDTNEIESAKWLRKAAEQNLKEAQFNLGASYEFGIIVPQDWQEAAKWYRKAADQGYAVAQKSLGVLYFNGRGVQTNYDEANKWFRLSAEQGNADAERNLAVIYAFGDGVPKDYSEAFKWLYKEADQGISDAQNLVGFSYLIGMGVSKDNIEAYKWFNLSAAQGNQFSKTQLEELEQQMTMDQIAKAQKLTREYKPGQPIESSSSKEAQQEPQITGTGSGFFITDDGYLISNYHVVKDATKVRLFTSAGLIDAKVVQVDAANDLALLKADGKFSPLPIAASRSAHLGGTVATIGFPDPSLQGFSPKLAKGEIASLSGAGDDPRYFQISVVFADGHHAAGQFGRGAGGRAGQRDRHRLRKTGCLNSIGHERLAPGECELRGEEQFALELSGVGAGRGGKTQGAEHEG
jgi:TPR repeat protein